MTADSPTLENRSPHSNQHFPGLDTLRALAILMVIPRHAAELLGKDFLGNFWKQVFMHGWVGVDLFFVLSGFLIGSQLLQSVARDGRVNFGRFYLKRSLRIMPSFYFVLLIYLLWPNFREKPELDPAWRFLLYVMNYGRKGDAFSHAWSLCVEEHFYIVFPLLLAACAWRPKLFRPSALIAFIMIAEPLLRFYLWTKDAPFFVDVYRPSHTH
ncbi:MAG: acyltransferase, partial [Pseudomonadota bacterium]